MNRSICKTLTTIACVVGLGGISASAQEDKLVIFPFPTVPGTVWKAELGTAGDWFDEDLWTEGVPDATTPAFFVNGSETLLTGGTAMARSISMSSPNFGRSRITHTGGDLTLDDVIQINDGIYRQIGGRLEAQGITVGSLWLFLLPDVTEVPKPDVPCNSAGDVYCPPDPELRMSEQLFSLDGGVALIEGEVHVSQGQLEFIGGRLATGSMRVDGFGVAGNEPSVSQRGGVVAAAGDVKIQDGAYALSGGELNVERLLMGDPAMGSPIFLGIPSSRSPEFIQSGGSLLVRQNLELCVPGFVWPLPTDPTFTDVAYQLEAGTVDVGGDTVVGSLGTAPARFLQSGGTHRTVGTLRVEGEESRYELSDGQLHVGNLAISTNVFNGGGTFAISASADFVVDTHITFGESAEIEAMPGAQIQLAGGDVEVRGSDAALLADLDNLSLLVTGTDEWSTFEAASADLGAVSAGFDENFVWNELHVGLETQSANLRLVDNFNNQFGVEAVYVERLMISAGSTLDLNGLNLYYREAQIAGQLIASGGTLINVPVPEPTTLGLLLVAMLICSVGSHKARS